MLNPAHRKFCFSGLERCHKAVAKQMLCASFTYHIGVFCFGSQVIRASYLRVRKGYLALLDV